MARCPRCRAAVATLHPLPPAVITTALVAAISPDDGSAELEACRECIDALMAGDTATI